MVTGPIALAYNVSGVDKLILTPDGARRHLQRHDHHLERPEDRRDQPRRHPAVDWRSRPCTARRTPAPRTTSPSTWPRRRPGWTFAPGKSWTAPGGVAAQGSDGVSKQVKSTDGSIGYVEWGFAMDDGLDVAQIDNGGGAVELTAESAGKAVEAATGRRHRQGPGAQAGLRDQGAGRLPADPGHLRDRLLGRERRRQRRAAQVVPGLHLHRRPGRRWTSSVRRRCPPRSRAKVIAVGLSPSVDRVGRPGSSSPRVEAGRPGRRHHRTLCGRRRHTEHPAEERWLTRPETTRGRTTVRDGRPGGARGQPVDRRARRPDSRRPRRRARHDAAGRSTGGGHLRSVGAASAIGSSRRWPPGPARSCSS